MFTFVPKFGNFAWDNFQNTDDVPAPGDARLGFEGGAGGISPQSAVSHKAIGQ
jgi:hypothetical protein